MSVYYIRHLYIHIMFKKCQKHVKIIFIKDQKQNIFFCEDENIQFNFIGTKIKIIGTKNLFNPIFLIIIPNRYSSTLMKIHYQKV